MATYYSIENQRQTGEEKHVQELVAAEMVPNVDLCYLPGPQRGDKCENDAIPATAMYFYKRPDLLKKKLLAIYMSGRGNTSSEASTEAVVKLEHSSACKCKNCAALMVITDCGVCFKSLQGRSLRNCTHCWAAMCTECAKKMITCAFCREGKSVVENAALERILSYLTLPCQNAWDGCSKWLRATTRHEHEVCCSYKQLSCPFGNNECEWLGSLAEVLKHLKQEHDVTPTSAQRITFQVADMRFQCRGQIGKCTIYLCVDDQLFTIRITCLSRKLILSFSRAGFIRPVDESVADNSYGIWVNMKKVCSENPEEKTAFGTFESRHQRVELDTNAFLKADESVAEPIDFRLVTEITIKVIPKVEEEIPEPNIEN